MSGRSFIRRHPGPAVATWYDSAEPSERRRSLTLDASGALYASERDEPSEPWSMPQLLGRGYVLKVAREAARGRGLTYEVGHRGRGAELSSEADAVRDELGADPFTSDEDYGRLVEEAADADERASWGAEREPDEPATPPGEVEAIAALAAGVVRVGEMLERATGGLADSIAQTRAEQAELRDELVALSNRLEALTRKVLADESDAL